VSVSTAEPATTARKYFRTSAMGPQGVVFSVVLREEMRACEACAAAAESVQLCGGNGGALHRLWSCDSNDAS